MTRTLTHRHTPSKLSLSSPSIPIPSPPGSSPSKHHSILRHRRLPNILRRLRNRRTAFRLLVIILAVGSLQVLVTSYIRNSAAADVLKETPHPIAQRLATAAERWRAKVARQSKTYKQFEGEYMRRYGLTPPEGMEKWFERVREDGHVLVDEYDEMMKSLEPFRAMGGQEVLRRTLEVSELPTFSLLNISAHHSYFYGQDYRGSGKHYSREDTGPGIERVEGLAAMLQRHINYIPDNTVFAVSELAEPRVIVPWQDRPSTLSLFSPSPPAAAPHTLHALLATLQTPNASALLPTPNYRGEATGTAWELFARSCEPDSPARKWVTSLRAEAGGGGGEAEAGIGETGYPGGAGGKPVRSLPKRRSLPSSMDEEASSPTLPSLTTGKAYPSAGAVYNSPAFNFLPNAYAGITHEELCKDQELHQMQGAFYSDWRGLPALYPVFSPSKIDGFSDILIPSNFYYGDDARYSVEDGTLTPWTNKEPKVFWRGKTTGGGNTPSRHQLQYQRHRFVRLAQSLSRSLQSVLVPSSGSVLSHIKRAVGELNTAWLDVGFIGYTGCGDDDICELTRNIFPLKDKVPLKDMGKYKAILDLDGMAFSGRFVALMGMGSGVFKSSIYKDFSSEWIEPWLHYVPVSSGYQEIYNLLGYFLPLPASETSKRPSATQSLLRRFTGTSQSAGDKALQSIANAGVEWSDLVGNKPDIEAYVYRLALEWSRILTSTEDIVYKFAPDAE